MKNFSNKELRALATRAACGSFMPWGLAEEAGASVAWLERNGYSATPAFISLMFAFEDCDPSKLLGQFGTGKSEIDSIGPSCPIITGAFLSDQNGIEFASHSLVVRSVRAPMLLLPFLVWISNDLNSNVSVKWGDCWVVVCSDGIEVSGSHSDFTSGGIFEVAIGTTEAKVGSRSKYCPRTVLSEPDQSALEAFVLMTYLPESEHSRASGAGGGSVDED